MADVGKVRKLLDLWKDVFPTILPFYSVKCNSDPVFLKVMASLGVGFDCATKVSTILYNSIYGIVEAWRPHTSQACLGYNGA